MLTEEERLSRKREARRRYDSLKTKQYIMRLRIGADADIIEKLDSLPNKTEYIRNLVREDMQVLRKNVQARVPAPEDL